MKKKKRQLIKFIKSISLRNIEIEKGINSIDIEGMPYPYTTSTGKITITIIGYLKQKR